MRRSTVTNEAEIKHKKGALRTKDSAFAFHKWYRDFNNRKLEHRICAKELKNPLFHKTWAPQQFHCQACLKSFLAVQVSNQFQIHQGDMARCHVQWRSGTRPTQEEQVCYCIPRKSTIPMSAQSQPWFFWYVMQEDISWQTTSCTLPASDLARQLS